MATVSNAVLRALRLQGKVAVITGGSSGIGAATAKTFVAQGAKVVIADINDAAGDKLAQELGGPNVALYTRCDVTQEQQVAAAVDLSVRAFGGLDIMFNNAGVVGPLGPIDEYSMDEFDQVYRVNVKGVFMGVKHAARVMKPAGKGSIINVSSAVAHWGALGPYGYGVSKHALVGLLKNAAYELRGFNIRVNNIAPGSILTPIWDSVPQAVAKPLQSEFAKGMASAEERSVATAMGTPDVVANAVLFLASDDSSFVSGHSLVVDGSHIVIPASPLDMFFKKNE